MLILLTGGASNGKSVIAEKIVTKLTGKKLYIATMKPIGDEALFRIEKHKKMREGKSFETTECYYNINELDITNFDIILLECIPNLVANEMFDNGDIKNIFDWIEKIKMTNKTIIIVTNDVFSDTLSYTQTVLDYVKTVADINNSIANIADIVIEAVVGIEVVLKGMECYEKIC